MLEYVIPVGAVMAQVGASRSMVMFRVAAVAEFPEGSEHTAEMA